MDETKSWLSGADRDRRRRPCVGALSSIACAALVIAGSASAQDTPPATAPSGVTTVDPEPAPAKPVQRQKPPQAQRPAQAQPPAQAPRPAQAQQPAPSTPPRMPTTGVITITPESPPSAASPAQGEAAPPDTAPSGVTELSPEPAPQPSAEPAEPAPPPPSLILVPPQVPHTPAIIVAEVESPAAPAPSRGWSPVFTGSYFTRYELRSGYDDLGLSSPTARQRFLEGDAFFYRIRFGIGTGLFDVGRDLKVGLQFTPQAAGVFGNLPDTITDANLGLHEGYLRVQGMHTRVDAGRFELNYGDALVVGNLDWNEIGRSFDGVRARISSPSDAWLDLFATMLDEGRADSPRGQILDQSPGNVQGDVYFLGAYAAFGPSIAEELELDGYALVRTWAEAQDVRLAPNDPMSPSYRRESAAEGTIGLRAKQKIGLFDYRFEGGVQVGTRPGRVNAMAMPVATNAENVKVFAQHADLELGLSFAERYRVGLEGIYASGDDPSTSKNEGWDELFPTAHKFLGLTDAFVQNGSKRTNVASGVLHLTAAAHKSLTFQVDGHVFYRLEESPATYGKDGYAGAEVDAAAVFVLAKGLKLRGTYGIFLPDTGIYQDTLPVPALAQGADPVHFAEVELRYDLMP